MTTSTSPTSSDSPGDPGVVLELLDAGLGEPAVGGFTTRSGGVSAPPWDALDLALHVGDGAAAVQANRALLRSAVGEATLVFAEQVHGSGVAVVDRPQLEHGQPEHGQPGHGRPGHGLPGVDALVTATPGLALVVMAADCLPVLFADHSAGVVAAAHAGRAGLAAGVLEATLQAMRGLGARPDTTRAVLGPAVCGACYELPEELADEVGRQVPGSRATTRRGTPSVDLVAGAQALLLRAGTREVLRAGGCTVEQPERFFSHRRDGVTGRHAGVVRLVA